MLPIQQLRELQADFEPVRLAKESQYKEFEKLRREFVKLFPRARITRLTL